jgi:ribosomal protein L7Ae-like RNA K-turn-binding protein
VRYYFSDENKKKSYRSFNQIDKKLEISKKDLIILKSDTENIIDFVEYKNNKKKEKYSFWELLYND